MIKNLNLFIFLVYLGQVNAQMTTYGTTTGTCDCYQLTAATTNQAGSIWSPNEISLVNSFDLTFSVNLGDSDGGADGLVFVLRQSPGDPGASGGSLGYGGILNSIGVEIDTYYNAGNGDVVDDHIGMHSDGGVTHDLQAPVALPNVEDGAFHEFRATWDPTSFELEIFFDGASIFTYTSDLTTTIFGGDPIVYFGWTAGTGGAFNEQTVCSYRAVDFVTDHEDGLGAIEACPNELISFTDLSTSDLIYNSEDIIEWLRDFGDGTTSTLENPTHEYAVGGTYNITLLVKDITGCFSETTRIANIEGVDLSLTISQPTCNGFNDGSLTVNVPGTLVDPTFIITNSDGDVLNIDNSNSANSLSEGWYYAVVEDTDGCGSGIDSFYIADPPEISIDLTTADAICNGEASAWALVDTVYDYTGDYNMITYIWSPNPLDHDGIGADSIWSIGAGNFTITINDENGCSVVLPFTIEEPEPIDFSQFGSEPAYCRQFGYQSGNGVVFAAAIGGTPDYTYLWTNLGTGETSTSTTWGGLNPGTYEILVTDDNGCTLTESILLDSLNPIAEFNALSDELDQYLTGTLPVEVSFENASTNFANPNNPNADTTFFWNLDFDNTSWFISEDYFEIIDTTYGVAGEYNVCLVALNKNGCSDTTCKIITIYDPIALEGVNIFTPDGDGINDLFTFSEKAASIVEFDCQIFNRWGIKVGEITDINSGWDGNDLNGDECTDGTYFYIYNAVSQNGTELSGQGDLQLSR